MPAKPKHREPNRLRARSSVTLDPATKDRLLSVARKVGGIRGISAAIDYAAQFADDRIPDPES